MDTTGYSYNMGQNVFKESLFLTGTVYTSTVFLRDTFSFLSLTIYCDASKHHARLLSCGWFSIKQEDGYNS